MIDLRFDSVSKRYRVREEDAATRKGNPVLRKLRNLRGGVKDFWAVRDVSFEVERGEALGVIGHNGAGKSTMLKLFSGITAPTSGEIMINGRLAALIEVGSGFHPDLTGRENVFLSGSILGMRRREIAAKLDSIIDFAGVRQFIDTPVKRYSSGMYVRLGFAIAAHLDPDILLLDEVLAVGDADFQKKCFERIANLQKQGTTIVFISHDLTAVERLCDRALLMQRGRVIAEGTPRDVIVEYQHAGHDLAVKGARGSASREWDKEAGELPGNDIVRLRRARTRTEDGETVGVIDIRRPVGIEVTYDVLRPGHVLIPNYHLFDEQGHYLFGVQDVSSEWLRRPRPAGRYTSTAWIPGNFLSEGNLSVAVNVSTHIPETVLHVSEHDAVSFRVVDKLEGGSARGDFIGEFPGLVRPLVDWTTRFDAVGEQTIRLAEHEFTTA